MHICMYSYAGLYLFARLTNCRLVCDAVQHNLGNGRQSENDIHKSHAKIILKNISKLNVQNEKQKKPKTKYHNKKYKKTQRMSEN